MYVSTTAVWQIIYYTSSIEAFIPPELGVPKICRDFAREDVYDIVL